MSESFSDEFGNPGILSYTHLLAMEIAQNEFRHTLAMELDTLLSRNIHKSDRSLAVSTVAT